MNEQFLHYLWKHKLFNKSQIFTTDGLPVEIISVGEHNHNAGPDFFNGRIKIDGTEWAGSIEIHLKSTDWFKHGHDKDSAYNNVILHVVAHNDGPVITSNNISISTIELNLDSKLTSNYQTLINSKKWVPCEDYYAQIDPLLRNMWNETLLIQRLLRKSKIVQSLLAESNNDFDEVFFKLLCSNMGFKTNKQPFEQLARSINLRIIRSIGNNFKSLEALLFGIAGFLQSPADEYQKTLATEYLHLSNRFGLQTMDPVIWKFARMRPVNFPTIRLAHLAHILSRSTSFTDNLKKAIQIQDVRNLFDAHVSEYWQTHYTFGKPAKKSRKNFGTSSIDNIIINSIFPFLFEVAKYYDDNETEKKVFRWMEALPPEINHITKQWQLLGAENTSAYDSQALIELYNEYCIQQKCLNCRLGGYIIREK
ncbi:MAG: DUF2851 domain-containing protein [Salinivirgaceae bacterium]|nr:MAG: DUF2851 domain-containing protein [Salinivirgaceae bacterium]